MTEKTTPEFDSKNMPMPAPVLPKKYATFDKNGQPSAFFDTRILVWFFQSFFNIRQRERKTV